jgi:hypothetical protein
MKIKISLAMVVVISALLTSCQEDSAERSSWVPAIEQTGFEYLSQSAARIEAALLDSREKLIAGDQEKSLASLADAEDAAQVLRYYDVPMTEVRQLIYDASRLHALLRSQDALEHLNRSAEILLKIEQQGSPPVQKSMQGLRTMTSELQMLLEEERRAPTSGSQASVSRKVAAKFSELGHKVNLLALKSDLVLSGADFSHGMKAE